MKQIAQFFTIYWCIYFPTCIAYNDLPGFSSIDEMMTSILIVYTFMKHGKKNTNNYPWKEYYLFFKILIFYIIYSFFLHVNIFDAVIYDLIQQIRPWSVIYCTWILNPQFNKKQKKWMLRVMVLTLISYFFSHPETVSNISGGEYRNVPFGQLAICTSMAWFLLTDSIRKNLIIATVIAAIGLLSLKFKYYGQFGAWMFMLYFMKEKFKWGKAQMGIQIAFLFSLVITLGWERFDAYYIEGIERTDVARPLMNKAAWQILWDYFPFGSGLGTFATAASAVYYSPLWAQYDLNHVWGLTQWGEIGHGRVAFHADNFIASFAQLGFFGIYFFLWFWIRRLKQFQKIEDMRYYKVAMMAFFCIVIEWFGDSSFLSGKGMGYMMLLGLCLNKSIIKTKNTYGNI